MPRLKSNPLSSLSVADLRALLADKEIEELRARQAELEGDLRRVEKELARLVKGAAVARPAAAKRAKRATPKPGTKKAGKKAAAKKAPATGTPSIEAVVIDLLTANGAPMAVPEILDTIKKRKLVKTKAANFDGVLRQAMYKSSKIKRVGRGVYRT